MRILLVQLADIGDLILTTPAIHALRQALPDAHITLLTSAHAARILEAGFVDECLTFDRQATNSSLAFFMPRTLWRVFALRQAPYDAVVFFHHFTLRLGTLKFALLAWASGARRRLGLDNGKGWFLTERLPDKGFGARHQAQYWLDLVGMLGASTTPARAHVALDGGVLPIATTTHKRIIIHAGSGGYSPARRWLPEYFAQVADTLHEHYQAQIVLVGTPEDGAAEVQKHMKTRPINLTGKTTLTQLADVIRSADLYIGADSGVMHLAAAVRTPTIALFGSSNPQAWGAWSPQGTTAILQSQAICSPCSYVGQGIGARNGCAARTCMKALTPAQVLDTAHTLLSEQTPAAVPARPASHLATHHFIGVAHHAFTPEQWTRACQQAVTHARTHLFILSDYQLLLKGRKNSILQSILARTDVLLPCEGALWWAANWQHADLPHKWTRLQASVTLIEAAEKHGWRVFLVGKHATQARALLSATLPKLSVVGAHDGKPSAEAEDTIAQAIQDANAHIVLAGWGGEQDALWLARNAPRLKARLLVCVGDTLTTLAEANPRPPAWAEAWGIAPFVAFLQQPHTWRVLWDAPRFVWQVITKRGQADA